MRAIWEFLGSIFNGKSDVRVIKVEGKQTKESKGRTERLKEAREVKESKNRTGNKASE